MRRILRYRDSLIETHTVSVVLIWALHLLLAIADDLHSLRVLTYTFVYPISSFAHNDAEEVVQPCLPLLLHMALTRAEGVEAYTPAHDDPARRRVSLFIIKRSFAVIKHRSGR